MKKQAKKGILSKKSRENRAEDDSLDLSDGDKVPSPVKKRPRLSRKKSKDEPRLSSPSTRKNDDSECTEDSKKLVPTFGKRKHSGLAVASKNSLPSEKMPDDVQANNEGSVRDEVDISASSTSENENTIPIDVQKGGAETQSKERKISDKQQICNREQQNDQDMSTEQRTGAVEHKKEVITFSTNVPGKVDAALSTPDIIKDDQQVGPAEQEPEHSTNIKVAGNEMNDLENKNAVSNLQGESAECTGTLVSDKTVPHIANQSQDKNPNQECCIDEMSQLSRSRDQIAKHAKDTVYDVQRSDSTKNNNGDEDYQDRKFDKEQEVEVTVPSNSNGKCTNLTPPDAAPLDLSESMKVQTENEITNISVQIKVNAEGTVPVKDTQESEIQGTPVVQEEGASHKTPVVSECDTAELSKEDKSESKVQDIQDNQGISLQDLKIPNAGTCRDLEDKDNVTACAESINIPAKIQSVGEGMTEVTAQDNQIKITSEGVRDTDNDISEKKNDRKVEAKEVDESDKVLESEMEYHGQIQDADGDANKCVQGLECVDGLLDDMMDITFSQVCKMEEQCMVENDRTNGANSTKNTNEEQCQIIAPIPKLPKAIISLKINGSLNNNGEYTTQLGYVTEADSPLAANNLSTVEGSQKTNYAANMHTLNISSGTSNVLRPEDLEAGEVVRGIIEELKGLNQMIIGAKKQVETARRQRQQKQKQQQHQAKQHKQQFRPRSVYQSQMTPQHTPYNSKKKSYPSEQ